jgi:PleD family two-component response regulator
MGALQQVLVVDDGVRAVDRSLSGELANLGYASVTASMEAADDVLAVIARPSAVLLQAPTRRDPGYARRAARLRSQLRDRGIPVILIGDSGEVRSGGPVDLATRLGAYVAAQPDL